MMPDSFELLTGFRAELGEGPSWDSRSNLLYWVDILGGNVHMYQPDNGKDTFIYTGRYVSSVIPRKSDGVLITLQHGFYTLDLKTHGVMLICKVERDLAGNRFNDGKCDAYGRYWAGTMSMDGLRSKGALYFLSGDRSVTKVLSGVSTSNGLGWSPDNKFMYYIDTPTRRVVAFDFDLRTGGIRNQRTAVDFSDQEGSPDGMAVDKEGMIWVAHWGGSRVSRWNPSTGNALDRIILPTNYVTSCCFGGRNLDELYITTARRGSDEQTPSENPYAGALFRAKVEVEGLPTYYFDG
jgi:sugar lactone lactonase YvrE